jgi:hypothetical protein
MGAVLNDTLDTFYSQNSLNTNDCSQNSVVTTWNVDLRVNGAVLVISPFYTGIGPFNVPTNTEWVNALSDTLNNLLTSGYSYNIDEDIEQITVFNNNCQPNFDDFQINIGLEFEIYCNG